MAYHYPLIHWRLITVNAICRDCWYLYALNPVDKYISGHVDVEPDQTIEILMQDLEVSIMEKFSKKKVASGKEATMVCVKTRVFADE